ncbi:hypothetical protein [uncultured Chitinophaga sp.]|uniref:hypothetical protein n=1 Tax=uncultured Chitinophaga sp. TaxID=339340 RepID=UPI0025D85662|nr:hypothetical protein [uncultured Chitinophaga sp.]
MKSGNGSELPGRLAVNGTGNTRLAHPPVSVRIASYLAMNGLGNARLYIIDEYLNAAAGSDF